MYVTLNNRGDFVYSRRVYEELGPADTPLLLFNPLKVTCDAKNPKRTEIVLAIAPPQGTLLRTGGDYKIEVTGAVDFGQLKDTGDPIVRTFDAKTGGYDGEYGAVKFNADGTVVTTNGYTGIWKAFDRENRIYAIQLGRSRYTAQYIPGSGLVEPSDPTRILFQELRR
jgi:hypothetical protein